MNSYGALKNGCVKLIDSGDFKKRASFVTLLWNIKHRSSFAVAETESKLRDLAGSCTHSFNRHMHPDGSAVAYVGNLYVAICSESRREMLFGEVIGFNPKKPLTDGAEYCIDVRGGTRDDVLTEIDYFTISEDETGLCSNVRITRLVDLDDWCKRSK